MCRIILLTYNQQKACYNKFTSSKPMVYKQTLCKYETVNYPITPGLYFALIKQLGVVMYEVV